MKHIKTFENKIYTKYQEDDYVLMKYKVHNGENVIYKINTIDRYMYLLVDPLNINSTDNGWYIEDDILRKATPEEIERIKIEIDSRKYNL